MWFDLAKPRGLDTRNFLTCEECERGNGVPMQKGRGTKKINAENNGEKKEDR
jgi:hypothetical protein